MHCRLRWFVSITAVVVCALGPVAARPPAIVQEGAPAKKAVDGRTIDAAIREYLDSRDDADDARLSFVYQEAVRGLTHQQGVVENVNTRARNPIFATLSGYPSDRSCDPTPSEVMITRFIVPSAL